MRAIESAVVIAHVSLATLQDRLVEETEEYDTDPEDIEEIRPRVFVAQTGRCPLVARVRALLIRSLPPLPPIRLQITFAACIVFCNVIRIAVFLFQSIRPERSQAIRDTFLRQTM